VSNYLEDAVERALLLAFAQQCERFGASDMADINDSILDQAKNTTTAILDMKDNLFRQNLKHRQLEAESLNLINSMTGIIPPVPMTAPKKSARIKTNEDLLQVENESLRAQLAERDIEKSALDARLAEAYELVQKFRQYFEDSTKEQNSAVFEMQSEVFKVLGGQSDIAP